MRRKHVPQRTCIGCRQAKAKRDLIRLVHTPEGQLVIDVTGKLTAGKHHLAMRVYNVAAAGGVFKPVTVLVGPDDQSKAASVAKVPGAASDMEEAVVRGAGQDLWRL